MGELFDPLKDSMLLFRSRLLKHLQVTEETAQREQSLHLLIQAESMNSICDETAAKLCAMVSVASSDLGAVMRKLRAAYADCFRDAREAWKEVHSRWKQDEEELGVLRSRLASYADDLKERETLVRRRMEVKIAEMERQHAEQADKDNLKLKEAEQQIQQMAESLRALNGIFKTMQQDEAATKATDLILKCTRLESAVESMGQQVNQLDRAREELRREAAKNKQLEAELRQKSLDLLTLRGEMARRDATIATLMEKEALINAEMATLKQITEKKSTERDVEEADLEGPPTSVLCIKCKKGLDDVSNIRSVLLAARDDAANRLECEGFRVLLPNLRGRRPDRSSSWVRGCMRSILVCKMREDVVIHNISGEHARFPHFVYTWFERETLGFGTAANNATLLASDEDRWGLYYGARAMSKDADAEAMLFWSLLDEVHQQDGLQFLMHCMSVAFTMGGAPLWAQFGGLMHDCGSIKRLSEDPVPTYIWLSLRTATDATKAIMSKAAAPQLATTLETIDTMKEAPVDGVLDSEEPVAEEKTKKTGKSKLDRATAKETEPAKEPTHINFFMWLRVMLRQFQEDQNTKHAAIRLMFEAASVGALTPQLHVSSEGGKAVEYPQFQAICSSLFPTLATSDYVALFSRCYEAGKKKVTADVFTKMADANQYFSRTMYLEAIPLLTPEDYVAPSSLREATPEITSRRTVIPKNMTTVGKAVKPFQDHMAAKIHSIVHRKLAVLTPELRQVSLTLPERWRSVLKVARDRVQTALNESMARIVRRQKVSAVEGAKAPDSFVHAVDGLQPYNEYKRLLALIIVFKSYTENPFIPSDIFANEQQRTLAKPNLCRAEALVTHLEDAIFICGGESSMLQKSFEQARITIVVRRLQATYRAHKRKQLLQVNATNS